MNKSIAEVIVMAGGAVGIVVWVFGIRCYLKMKSLSTRLSKEGRFTGISKAEAAKALLKHAATRFRITDRSEDGFTLQLLLSNLIVKFESQAEGTCFQMDVDMSRLSRVFSRIMAVFVLGLEPLFVICIPCLLWFLAVPNEDPNIRWQVVQVVQIIHVLWPPFLIYFLYKMLRNRVETVSDNIQTLIEVTE